MNVHFVYKQVNILLIWQIYLTNATSVNLTAQCCGFINKFCVQISLFLYLPSAKLKLKFSKWQFIIIFKTFISWLFVYKVVTIKWYLSERRKSHVCYVLRLDIKVHRLIFSLLVN